MTESDFLKIKRNATDTRNEYKVNKKDLPKSREIGKLTSKNIVKLNFYEIFGVGPAATKDTITVAQNNLSSKLVTNNVLVNKINAIVKFLGNELFRDMYNKIISSEEFKNNKIKKSEFNKNMVYALGKIQKMAVSVEKKLADHVFEYSTYSIMLKWLHPEWIS